VSHASQWTNLSAEAFNGRHLPTELITTSFAANNNSHKCTYVQYNDGGGGQYIKAQAFFPSKCGASSR